MLFMFRKSEVNKQLLYRNVNREMKPQMLRGRMETRLKDPVMRLTADFSVVVASAVASVGAEEAVVAEREGDRVVRMALIRQQKEQKTGTRRDSGLDLRVETVMMAKEEKVRMADVKVSVGTSDDSSEDVVRVENAADQKAVTQVVMVMPVVMMDQ